jgi:dipeptidyl aminopeptidase/acylaminoacyl peptidase
VSPVRSSLDFEAAVDAVVITDVQLSPDGREVVYVTASASTDEGLAPASTLWLVSAEGGPSRRLTTARGLHRSPRWSPDGRRLAFLADRDQPGVAQVGLLDLARGGEAVGLTGRKSGVSGLEWSPNGELIAFTAPGTAGLDEDHKASRDQNFIDESKGETKEDALWLLKVPEDAAIWTGAGLLDERRLSPVGLHVGPYRFAWSPDNASVVVAAAESSDPYDLNPLELVRIELQGDVHRLTRFEGLEMPGGQPRLSPDGLTVAFNGAQGAFPASYSLQTVPSTGGTPRVVVPDYEGSLFAFAWLADGKRLIAATHEGQRGRIVVIDPQQGTVSDAVVPFDRPGAIVPLYAPLVSLAADANRVAFVRADDTSYGDVFVADLGGAARRLTDVNPWTSGQDFGEVREVSWTSFDGMEIQGLVILPVGYQEGSRYPALVELHGGTTGFWAHALEPNCALWGQHMARRGFAVLRPNQRGSGGRGREFLRATVGCYGEPDGRDVIAGIDNLVQLGIADGDRLVVGGHSAGGYLTNWTVTHTGRFKAAVSVCGISDWVSLQGTAVLRAAIDRYFGPVEQYPDIHWQYSPVRYINAVQTPTLILFGEKDEFVPPTQGSELFKGLKSCGVETTFVVYPREGHMILERPHQIDLLRRAIDWFDKHVGGDVAPRSKVSVAVAGRDETSS